MNNDSIDSAIIFMLLVAVFMCAVVYMPYIVRWFHG